MLTPEQLAVLYLPFLICVILTGIHGYLGIHVLARKVIFVDIALAQIAALGSAVAFLMGYDPHTEVSYFFSLGFAVLAAVVFAGSRTRHERVPQEAIIGLTYAIAQAASVLLADIAPHGAEHLKEMMEGSIVWVTPYQVKKTFIMYSCLGLFHFLLRKPFLLISQDPEEAFKRGMSVRLWDLLFYASFGMVITSSVQIAGVLLVFCYLVAPAVFAVMFAERLGARLAIAWTLGTVVSALGLLFSYDRPSGPTIMVFFAIALIIAAIYKKLSDVHHPIIAFVLAIAVVSGLGAGGLTVFKHFELTEHEHEHEEAATHQEGQEAPHGVTEHGFGTSFKDLEAALKDEHPNVRAAAALALGKSGAPLAATLLVEALRDPSDAVKENAARALADLASPTAIAGLQQTLSSKVEDPWVRLRLSQALAMSGEPSAIAELLDLAGGTQPRLLRVEALTYLLKLQGKAPAPSPIDVNAPEGQKALADVTAWWKEKGTTLKLDRATKTYQ